MDLASINVSKVLIEFKPLIYKTMRRLNIHPKNMNYDDFFQELQIKLVKIYKSFDGDPLHVDTDRYKFVAYAGNGLYWRGIDLFKRNSFNSLPIIEDQHLERMSLEDDITEDLPERNIILEDFFKQAKPRLSETDYSLLKYLADGKYTITEIAELLQVSRGTIYKRRNHIQNKLQDLKECLMD